MSNPKLINHNNYSISQLNRTLRLRAERIQIQSINQSLQQPSDYLIKRPRIDNNFNLIKNYIITRKFDKFYHHNQQLKSVISPKCRPEIVTSQKDVKNKKSKQLHNSKPAAKPSHSQYHFKPLMKKKLNQFTSQFIKQKCSFKQDHLPKRNNLNHDLGINPETLYQCPICISLIPTKHLCYLQCNHSLHNECFQLCMKQSIQSKKFPLICPVDKCNKLIQPHFLKNHISKQLLEKFYQFSLKSYVEKNLNNVSWCPTAGCSSVFQFDSGVVQFECGQCLKNYCLKCKAQRHTGLSCKEYEDSNKLCQQDSNFLAFIRGTKCKQCPKCKFWVQKSSGCCHITCRCTYEFCYKCGQQHGTCNCKQIYDDYYDNNQQQQYELQMEIQNIELRSDQHSEISLQQRREQNATFFTQIQTILRENSYFEKFYQNAIQYVERSETVNQANLLQIWQRNSQVSANQQNIFREAHQSIKVNSQEIQIINHFQNENEFETFLQRNGPIWGQTRVIRQQGILMRRQRSNRSLGTQTKSQRLNKYDVHKPLSRQSSSQQRSMKMTELSVKSCLGAISYSRSYSISHSISHSKSRQNLSLQQIKNSQKQSQQNGNYIIKQINWTPNRIQGKNYNSFRRYAYNTDEQYELAELQANRQKQQAHKYQEEVNPEKYDNLS